jgi:hypothetical protein
VINYPSVEHVLCWANVTDNNHADVWGQIGWMQGTLSYACSSGSSTAASPSVYTEEGVGRCSSNPNNPNTSLQLWAYALQPGSYYAWRSRGYQDAQGHNYIVSDIFWNNTWTELAQSLNTAGACTDSTLTAKYCAPKTDVEVYSVACYNNHGDPNYCPGLDAGGNGISQANVQFRSAPGNWFYWDKNNGYFSDTTTASGQGVYSTCWTFQRYQYTAKRSTHC